jgi:NADPH:quinone reductase
MLGICITNNFPLISIARTDEAKRELEKLGAKNIVVQTDDDFREQLKELAQQQSATAIYDGVGGEILNEIIGVLPINSTIYSYGYLGGKTPLMIHTSILMKGITIKDFGNFKAKTVQDTQLLKKVLSDISEIIETPHFKTKTGKKFKLSDIDEALIYSSLNAGKAALYPFE